MLCFKVLNGMDPVLRAKDANQILLAVLPLEYGVLISEDIRPEVVRGRIFVQ